METKDWSNYGKIKHPIAWGRCSKGQDYLWLFCWMHTIVGRNQMGYDFVEVLMQIFVVGGNQVGCFVGAFMY